FTLQSPIVYIEQVRAFFNKRKPSEEFAKKYWPLLGIDNATQQKLITKIKKGEILDAYRSVMKLLTIRKMMLKFFNGKFI
ncbi:hypothetical protein, partial [Thermoanaerobacter thermocopriae]|uniref:hypothetical protein n=1 Tax=Thermoanaerobacter thermocopriae TaxID=29350 RepID=UPI000B0363DD